MISRARVGVGALVALLVLAVAPTASAQVTVERGREVHQLFLSGQLDALWALRSPEAAEGGWLSTREALERSQRDFQQRYGARLGAVSDSLLTYQGRFHYTTIDRYAGYAGDLRFTWIFDSAGLVRGFTYPRYSTPSSAPRRSSGQDLSDTLVILTALGGGMIFLVLLFVGIFAFVFRRHRRLGRKWSEAGRRLGLELEPLRPGTVAPLSGFSSAARGAPTIAQRLVGRRGEQEVALGVRIESRGTQDARRVVYFTYVQVGHLSPFWSGLAVHPAGALDWLWSGVGAQEDLQVGDAELDKALVIRTLDLDFTRRLLTAPQVREGLLAQAGNAWKPLLDDQSIRLERQQLVLDPGELSTQLERALELSRRLAAARAALSSANERILRDVWGAAGRRLGLAQDRQSGALRGRLGGFEVQVEAAFQQRRFWTIFRVLFDRPLGVGLSITREGALTDLGKLLGMQDIQVGDPAFDSRFLIKGQPPEQVRALLTPEVRRHLSQLQDQAKQLTVQDAQLTVEVDWLVSEDGYLQGGLEQVLRAAEELARVARGPAGPYRA